MDSFGEINTEVGIFGNHRKMVSSIGCSEVEFYIEELSIL